MDLRRLLYFVTVAEEGNVGRAARRLHMSQPPLSQRIRELEAELGCALFERTPAGMCLTRPGEILLTEARDLLARVDSARERVRAAAGAQRLVVGVLGPGEQTLSARVAPVFRQAHPGARVELRQGGFSDPTMGLAAGAVDLAVTRAPFDTTGLVLQEVTEEPCVVVLPADHPLSGARAVRLADLAGCSWVRLPAEADAHWRAFWQPVGDAGGPEVRSVDECMHAVLWDGAVAMVPARVAQRSPAEGVVFRPITDAPPSRLVLAWRRTESSPLVSAYARLLAEVHRATP
ncbi:LysR family transcriptional regulator [Planomonospora sp. ID67723]|uniref:LysR family transcriptional regulator n=1 Tax=Planomonospora sp. ID67723 TaxID=2738134 RepID=UPI0018C442A7|nr:LysR substrate-binding domain-containing protein [Planomonospora sp. ID67723]MBG0831713.1 LysR family transcriptional regulator [Planomonospora sp. ID67723]